jgi:CheY-like chemotaxis protein
MSVFGFGFRSLFNYCLRQLLSAAAIEICLMCWAIDWLNRADQGFWRLQDDIVVKFMPYRNKRLPIAGERRSAFMFRLGIWAENGDEIEQMAAKNNDFSLILTDIRMPAMSGIELATLMLQKKPNIRILVMIAYEISPRDLESNLPIIKGEDILQKPFRLEQVCTAVKKRRVTG